MKLTSEYFLEKIKTLQKAANDYDRGITSEDASLAILHQIANDATKAQRKKCRTQVCYGDCKDCAAALSIPQGGE